ncbi:restriction endonuclease [Coriobacteriia bacterium Es71-Z0120]|uniref:restriction endonuclease n=1 Tax=Parvivirga hydrogeniphila TaxID=2939460 RepID=UPI0022608E70|nr:restriction endonuclease [Parvivirga hydrogeniphila]MCL4079016.1 restriction endonuclease [Parvivirga hydrogeniphila]
MSIPDYQTLMLPLLNLLRDGEEHGIRQCIEKLAAQFGLTSEERSQLLPSGQQPVFDNRVGWARTYLKKAGLLESPRRGTVRITYRGKEVLAQSPGHIDVQFLMQFSEFREFMNASRHRTDERNEKASGDMDPVEEIELAFSNHQEMLVEELKKTIRQVSPAFFEQLVVRLLTKMGYGARSMKAADVIGSSGDEGIDGVIYEDKLGLDVIYIQAKKWDNPVGRPEIQRFVGALHGKRARKGVFFTTSSFSRDAQDYVRHLDPTVVLIDGEELARLMLEHNLGVTVKAVYELKSLDRDFFEEVP